MTELNILILDDDRNFVEVFADTINFYTNLNIPAMTVNIAKAYDLTTAHSLTCNKCFQIAFIDGMLASQGYHFDGLHFARELRELQPATRVIIVTAYPWYFDDALVNGFDAIFKGQELDPLIEKLQNLILGAVKA